MKDLDADGLAVVKKKTADMRFALTTLAQTFEKEEVSDNEELIKNILGLVEYGVADLSKKVGIPTQSQTDVEERHARMRQLNERVRELEKQLGATVGPEHLTGALKELGAKFKHWWRHIDGCGLVSDFRINEWGTVKAKLSLHLTGDGLSTDSETPVSDKERRKLWLESLKERGFQIVDEDRYTSRLIDNDHNRKLICDTIKAKFPTAIIAEIKNHHDRKHGFLLCDAIVYIYDLREVDALEPATE
jgi:hypothetical protein